MTVCNGVLCLEIDNNHDLSWKVDVSFNARSVMRSHAGSIFILVNESIISGTFIQKESARVSIER